MEQNPLFEVWNTPFNLPPFGRIKPEHFMPAFEYGMDEERKNVAAIAENVDAPTFENTILALEMAGKFLEKTNMVFDCLQLTVATDEIDKIDAKISPLLTALNSGTFQSDALYKRVDALYQKCDEYGVQERRLIEKYHRQFFLSGAHLNEAEKNEVKNIRSELTVLVTKFNQNVRNETNAYALELSTEEDRAGLSEAYLSSAENNAKERGKEGYVATLGLSATEAFLTESSRRDLRETVFKASKARGRNDNQYNNVATIEKIAQLRSRMAEVLGFETFADFQLSDKMAGNPAAVEKLHKDVWGPARKALLREQALLEEVAREDGMNDDLQPWDWPYYANKVRVRDYALDESEVRQYLPIDRCLDAMFDAANRLFGLNFKENKDIPVYHPDVRAWEVTDRDGKHLAIFLGDYFARPGKSGGAFMSELQGRNKLKTENNMPIVYNVCNFAKPSEGAPALLSLEEYSGTLFHEFGHGLHGMLTEAKYPTLAGTNVLRDFVELPSQLFELWALSNELLTVHARHWKTGEIMPKELREKIHKAELFGQGRETAEYLASSFTDMEWYTSHPGEVRTVAEVEHNVVEKMQLPTSVQPRHKSPHFTHTVSGYAAGYYSYLWADTLVADVYGAFVESGDVFSPALGQRLYETIYSRGDSDSPENLFRAFRGRDPDTTALIKLRGFDAVTGEAAIEPATPAVTDKAAGTGSVGKLAL